MVNNGNQRKCKNSNHKINHSKVLVALFACHFIFSCLNFTVGQMGNKSSASKRKDVATTPNINNIATNNTNIVLHHCNAESKTDSDDPETKINSTIPEILRDDTIDIKIRNKNLLIFGYIRNELSHSKQLIDFIFKIILKLYPLNDIKWSTSNYECSSRLKHSNSDLTLKRQGGKRSFAQPVATTGFVNTVITNEICKKFDIEFIIHGNYGDIYFGFISSKSALYNGNFNIGAPFKDDNKNRNISSYFHLWTQCRSLLYYDNINEPRILFNTEKSREAYKPGHDIIKLLFDFENDKIEIYIDNKYLDTLPLNGYKSILFGGSFYMNGTSIEIKGYNFHNN